MRPVLFRPPYSSTPDAVSVETLDDYRRVAERGYLIALSDYDSKDWQRDGVDAIIDRATPPGDVGGIILFHDGGGDRAQTVEALDQLLTSLQRRGYRFDTMSEFAGLPADAIQPAADTDPTSARLDAPNHDTGRSRPGLGDARCCSHCSAC